MCTCWMRDLVGTGGSAFGPSAGRTDCRGSHGAARWMHLLAPSAQRILMAQCKALGSA